jgi:hypothetical protein
MAVTFEARLPGRLPDSLNVYALDAPKVTNANLTATARKLGLTGQGRDFIASSDSLGYREGRWELEMNRVSGAISYSHLDRSGIETEKAFDLTDRRADGVARRFLERAALFPPATMALRRVTHMRGASADLRTRTVTEKVLDAGVVYGRVVDDQPVDGPGGFCMVNIDPDGEVIGLRSIWRPLGRRMGKVKIKAPDEAMDRVRKLADRMRGDTTVVKATFGYFELGPINKQTVLEPVYAFVYIVRDGELAMKSAEVVHAGDRRFGTLLGRRRFPPPAQRPRQK